MKTLVLMIALSLATSAFDSKAQADSKHHHPPVGCLVKLPDGDVLLGNQKNDYCLLYQNEPGVEIEYFNTSHLHHTETFVCKMPSEETLVIIKNTFRNDQYKIYAFGYEYFGVSATSPVPNWITATSTSEVGYLEPEALTLVSDSSGSLQSLIATLKWGRAYKYIKVSCKVQ